MTSFGRQFDFMASSITHSLVTLSIDGITLLVQLMGVQNIIKTPFSPNKSSGKF